MILSVFSAIRRTIGKVTRSGKGSMAIHQGAPERRSVGARFLSCARVLAVLIVDRSPDRWLFPFAADATSGATHDRVLSSH
jgi:hypothetical protein